MFSPSAMTTYAAARTRVCTTMLASPKRSGRKAAKAKPATVSARPAPGAVLRVSAVAATLVIRTVLRPVAADRHRAPGRGPVLRAIEERVLALAAPLQARP